MGVWKTIVRLKALGSWEDGCVRVGAVIRAGVKTSYGKAKGT